MSKPKTPRSSQPPASEADTLLSDIQADVKGELSLREFERERDRQARRTVLVGQALRVVFGSPEFAPLPRDKRVREAVSIADAAIREMEAAS